MIHIPSIIPYPIDDPYLIYHPYPIDDPYPIYHPYLIYQPYLIYHPYPVCEPVVIDGYATSRCHISTPGNPERHGDGEAGVPGAARRRLVRDSPPREKPEKPACQIHRQETA